MSGLFSDQRERLRFQAARIDALLNANNAEVERRRAAEKEVARLQQENTLLLRTFGEEVMRICEKFRAEKAVLAEAARSVYEAAWWKADRPCDEIGLWTRLRDALGMKPGHATKLLKSEKSKATDAKSGARVSDDPCEYCEVPIGCLHSRDCERSGREPQVETRTFQHSMPEHPELDELLAAARKLPPATPEQKDEYARSFVYGNLSIDNPSITRKMVDDAFVALGLSKPGAPAMRSEMKSAG